MKGFINFINPFEEFIIPRIFFQCIYEYSLNSSFSLMLIPVRFSSTCRSDRFRSYPRQISSESDIFHKKSIGSDGVFVGFPSIGIRPGFRRNSTEHHGNPTRSDRIFMVLHRIPIDGNPTKTPSGPIEILRSNRIRSHMNFLGYE